ncbi:MAG: protein kinase [Planctomycetes bacterium]|nr:protein kinase [Planctomycetota bacterium]
MTQRMPAGLPPPARPADPPTPATRRDAAAGDSPAGAPAPAGATAQTIVADARTRIPSSPEPAAPGGDAAPPRQFGRYRILREIARGGMGAVYRAHDTQLQRTVALKVMLGGDEASAEERERFRREGLLAARVQHSGIVPIYDVGEQDGRLYLTMELIEGESLAGVLRAGGALPPRVALKIARDTARALAHAHDHGLIHRDVKPGNILLAPTGEAEPPRSAADTQLRLLGRTTTSYRVLLGDFGLAREIAQAGTRLTQTGMALGTPLYMAPEQATGESARVGPRSDVYSLGAVLYEMLCGKPPFEAPDALRLMQMVVLTDPPPLRRRAPGLHADLETIVARAMEKEPARRYDSATALADDIDRYLGGEVILARPAGPVERAWRRLRRHREGMAIGAAALLLLLGVTLYFTLGPVIARKRETARQEEKRRVREADAQRRLAAAEDQLAAGRLDEAVATGEALVKEYADAGRAGEAVRIPQAFDLLARAQTAMGQPTAALRERYRAYRAALGLPGSEGILLGVARQLADDERFEEALPLLLEVLRQTGNAAGETRAGMPPESAAPIDPEAERERREQRAGVHAAALACLGRVRLGTGDFMGAYRDLARAARSPFLSAGLRADTEKLRAVTAEFAQSKPSPGPGVALEGIDVDGDGTPELLRRVEGDLVAGRMQGGDFVEIARARLTDVPGACPARVHRLPLPAGAPPTLIVEVHYPKRERELVLLRREGAGFARLADYCPAIGLGELAAGDLEGDGDPEILVMAGRQLQLLRWREAARTLTPLAPYPFGSHSKGAAFADLNGDGRDEILVCGGEWMAFALVVFSTGPGPTGLEERQQTPVGNPVSLARVDRPGKPPTFAVGVGWDKQRVVQLRFVKTRKAFEEQYLKPGIYLMEARPDFTFAAQPLFAYPEWEFNGGVGRVARLRTRLGQVLWCTLSVDDVTRVRLFSVDGEGAPEPLARIALAPVPGALRQTLTAALDVDGDGLDEAVFDDGAQGMILGGLPQAEGAAAAAPAEEERTEAAGAHRAPHDPRLDFAAAAEGVGMLVEAEPAYREVYEEGATLADTEEAAKGLLRCLARGARHADLRRFAEEAADRFARLEVPVLREAVRLLDEGADYAEAAQAATRLTRAVDLDPAGRRVAGEEALRYANLAALPHRTRLTGAESLGLDWLATSPLAVERRADGGWTIFATGRSADRMAVRMGSPCNSWRLAGRLAVPRQEWSVDLHLGVCLTDPLEEEVAPTGTDGLLVRCGGGTNRPMHNIQVFTLYPGGDRQSLYDEEESWGTAPFGFELFSIAHRQRLIARVTGLGADPPERRGEVATRLPTGPAYVGWVLHPHGPVDFAGRFELTELTLESAGREVGPRPAAATSAVEFLLLANGRWVSGRNAEARALYDRAIALADLERARTDAARAAGLLPAAGGGEAADQPLAWREWAGVDGRFYRGLLRAAGGDAAGGREDLAGAWRLGRERCAFLVTLYAEPLLETRSVERRALIDFWRAERGAPATEEGWAAWAEATLREVGPRATQVLVEGADVRVERVLAIERVMPGSPAERAGLRPGDLLVRVEGRTIESVEDLRAGMTQAALAGRRAARLVGERAGGELEVQVPPGGLGVALAAGEMPRIRRTTTGPEPR